MIAFFKSILIKVGVDRAIGYTVIWRVLVAFGGIGSIFFIVSYLSANEQGYYYTFASLLTIQFFFELGLVNVITPFVAHENSYLKYESGIFYGPEEHISRLSSLLRFTVKWFFVISVLSFIAVSAAGYIFFSSYHARDGLINWKGPYILLVFVTASSLNIISILAFFEGLGKVQEVAKVKLLQQIIYLTLLFIFFSLGLKLYASPLASLAGFLFVIVYILASKRMLILKTIWRKFSFFKIHYTKEILPFQWRIAVSMISSYLMYQIFNPILFATDGPVVAGQMGLSLTALNGVFFIGLAWINTKIPLFSNLVAQKKFEELDKIFKSSTTLAGIISICLVALLIIFVVISNHCSFAIAKKFLPVFPLTFLSVAMFSNYTILALSIYLRSHKKEPFLILSVTIGILTAFSTIFFGKLAGVTGITSSFAMLTTFAGLTWAIIIFVRKRKEWHHNTIVDSSNIISK